MDREAIHVNLPPIDLPDALKLETFLCVPSALMCVHCTHTLAYIFTLSTKGGMRESVRCIMCIILLYLDRRQSQSSRRGIELINMDKSTAAEKIQNIPGLMCHRFVYRHLSDGPIISLPILDLCVITRKRSVWNVLNASAQKYTARVSFLLLKKNHKSFVRSTGCVYILKFACAPRKTMMEKSPAKLHLR